MKSLQPRTAIADALGTQPETAVGEKPAHPDYWSLARSGSGQTQITHGGHTAIPGAMEFGLKQGLFRCGLRKREQIRLNPSGRQEELLSLETGNSQTVRRLSRRTRAPPGAGRSMAGSKSQAWKGSTGTVPSLF